MSNSTTEYPVNFQDISDVDSDYNTEASEEQQELNMDLSFTLTCLQLLNTREDLFQGEIGDELKKLTNTVVNFYKENHVYLDNLVVEAQKERQRADFDDWNPELVDGYVYIPTAPLAQDNNEEEVVEHHACEELEQQEPEPFNEEEWAIEQANQWAKKIEENDIYREKLFVQAESNLNAADILSMELSTNTQSMFYYQQSAELYLKGAMLCKTEQLIYSTCPGSLYHKHALTYITEAIEYKSPMTEVAERLDDIARTGSDARSLCVRARYLSIDPTNTEEQPPCFVFNDLHLATARDCVLKIAKYCNAVHDNLRATRKSEEREQPQKGGEEQTKYIPQRIINAFISCFF